MATVAKDFKIKNGLIVEGANGTINGYDILTKEEADQTYIIGLIGGSANSEAVANTVVIRDGSANFAANVITADLVGDVTGDLTGNADTATALETARNIAGVSFDGTADISIAITDLTNVTADASEVNILDGALVTTTELNYLSGATSNVQSQLDDKAPLASPALSGTPTAPTASPETNDTQIATTAFVANAVGNLVDGAPELLNTLNELAAAIGDDENFATTLTTLVGTKQNILTPGDNIDITGNTISVVGMSNAISTAIDALDTDDIEEGSTNEYFTNARAEAALVTPLTTGTQTNITVTYDAQSGLYDFVAENGVADSTTDDLTEGTTNLYFSNTLAVDALEAVVPNFTEVDINDVATQVAATLAVPTASTVTAYDFAHATYRSAKFLVKAETASHTEISEVLLTLDAANNVSITEYAEIATNGSLFSVTADVDGADARIRVTTTENSTDVTVVGTLVK